MKKIYLFLDKRTNLSLSWMVLSRNQNHLHRKHCNPRSLALFRSKIHQILERNKMRSCLQLYVHGIVKCCTNCLRSRPIIYHVSKATKVIYDLNQLIESTLPWRSSPWYLTTSILFARISAIPRFVCPYCWANLLRQSWDGDTKEKQSECCNPEHDDRGEMTA